VRSSHQYIEGEITTRTGQEDHARRTGVVLYHEQVPLLSKENRAMERILRDDTDNARKGDITLKWFRHSLQLFAIDAQAQIAHFPTDVHVIQEIRVLKKPPTKLISKAPSHFFTKIE
jgi:hypothetical protein